VTIGSVPGQCGDVRLQFNSLAAGTYTVLLTDANYTPNAVYEKVGYLGDGFSNFAGGPAVHSLFRFQLQYGRRQLGARYRDVRRDAHSRARNICSGLHRPGGGGWFNPTTGQKVPPVLLTVQRVTLTHRLSALSTEQTAWFVAGNNVTSHFDYPSGLVFGPGEPSVSVPTGCFAGIELYGHLTSN
jgi:hypothetical protein